jgi:hypothetical protein
MYWKEDIVSLILDEILLNSLPDFNLGPYSKDLDINDGVLREQILAFLGEQGCASSHEPAESSALFEDDLLLWLMPEKVLGFSMCMALQYGGGNSLAGCGREDANLHFVHLMPKLRLDFSHLVCTCLLCFIQM